MMRRVDPIFRVRIKNVQNVESANNRWLA